MRYGFSMYRRKVLQTSTNKQTGSAIITALTLMIIVASIAYLMLARQSIVTQQTILNNNADKAYYYHNMAVTHAQVRLKDTLNSQVIFVADGDARILNFDLDVPPPEADSEISTTLYDLQGRFNLAEFNSLDIGDIDTVEILYQKFITLLEGAGIDPSDGQDIFESILAHILSLGFSFNNLSQLRLFFDDNQVELYERLITQMSVLEAVVPININTATIPVLMTLGDPSANEGLVSFDIAEAIVGERMTTPITEEILTDEHLPQLTTDHGVSDDDLTITSNYFLLETRIILNRTSQSNRQVFDYYTLFQIDSSSEPAQIRIAKESIGTPL